MATAPSFANLERLSEPFEENGKEYILVKTKSGTTRKVRWYEEPMKKIRPLKEVLGFTNGYITIFKGDTNSLLEWFQEEPKCRYHCSFGWYCVSEEELPTHIPAGIEPIKLYWADIANVEEDTLKSKEKIKQHIDSLIYDANPSEFQGKIGERLERKLTVIKVLEADGYYGHNSFHIFSDSQDNIYTWNTTTKTLTVGQTYNLKGTVKEHVYFHNVKQTNLTRCAICQDKTV